MSHYQTIQALGTPIVVHSGITQMLGSMTASALLSHIMYWSDKTDNPLGFYRTLDELKAETSLSDNELRTARKLLVKLGLVVETHKRLEHRLYFKFNAEVFDKLFGEYLANCENLHLASCEIHNPPPVKSTTGELLNPQFGSSENHSSLYTKITTKITTKNTTKITDKECVGENPPTQQPKTDENQTFENPKNSKSDKQASKKPKITFEPPSDFEPTDSQISKCNQNNLNAFDELENFTTWAIANGKGYANWSMGLNTWINNSIRFGKNKPQTQTPSKPNFFDELAKMHQEELKARQVIDSDYQEMPQ